MDPHLCEETMLMLASRLSKRLELCCADSQKSLKLDGYPKKMASNHPHMSEGRGEGGGWSTTQHSTNK